MNPRTRIALLALALLPPALLAGACAVGGPPTPKADKDAIEQYRARGYAHADNAAIEIRHIAGPANDVPWTATLVRAAGHGPQGLVVYLPGLGESDDVASNWIAVWARAGYAVLSVQPLGDDADVWATPEARSGDFERVARARFSTDRMSERIVRLAGLLREVQRRSQQGEAGLDGLDWTELALAGSDLGAYTVQRIAAADLEQRKGLGWTLTPRAFLAVSPYAARRPAAPALASAPILMISGPEDLDAYGVVGDVAVRHTAFDSLVGGDDYYLELGGVTHRWLCGHTAPPAAAPNVAVKTPMQRMAEDSSPASRQRPKSAHNEFVAPVEDEETPEERKARSASAADQFKILSQALTHRALSEVSFSDISLAFLDANLRASAAAHAWLEQSAGPWLQSGDRLKHR